MELWKEYRIEIEKNIELGNALQHSNDKLKILYRRLVKVFPEYEKKYTSSNTSLNITLETIESAPKYSTNIFDEIIDKINTTEDSISKSLSAIDDINFSSQELDEVIKEIKKGKIKSRDYIPRDKTLDFKISPIKKISLGGKMKKINIAIDGPSGSGKSSAAKMLAKKFGFVYINTGLVYRSVALYMIENNINVENHKDVIAKLSNIKIDLLENEVVFLNGEDATKNVRSDNVSQNASIIAAIPEVRKWALKIMQNKAKNKGVVMDGRDITFRVLPNAELKVFLDTDPKVRAQRRVEQNRRLGYSTNFDEILSEIKKRDDRDRNRKIDPLRKTEDAILIDSSEMTLEQVVKELSGLVKTKINKG